jgi:hypothetical protein
MKKVAIILLISCLGISLTRANTTEPISNIEIGNALNVTAESGLKMRTSPGLDSKVITVIPFGEAVEILADFLEEPNTETIEWVEGTWRLVSYDEYEGYVFDGFLTHLPIPYYEFEQSIEDLDLTYPLLSWTDYHYDVIAQPDTTISKERTKVTQQYSDGVVLKKYDNRYLYKVQVELENTRMMDAYQLLQNMLLDESEKITFRNKSLFIQTKNIELDKITVEVDNPVEIRKIGDNKVRITVFTFNEGCSL